MAKLILTKDKHLLLVRNAETNKCLRYNLKTKAMEKQKQNGDWRIVERAYKFFRGIEINDIEFEDAKFKDLLIITRDLNRRCKSVSTFLDRMNEAMLYENYIQEGVLFQKPYQNDWGIYRKNIFTHKLNEYDKNVINFFKKYDLIISFDFEDRYFNQYMETRTIIEKILNVALSLDLNNSQADKLLDVCKSGYIMEKLQELIETHKYNLKSLLKYCFEYLEPFENIKLSNAISLLRDYYNMGITISRKVKKYPKYLHSMHDIITANYESYKKEYDQELFKARMKQELVFEDKEFCILIPETTQDIVEEGTSLNHCVSSYVERVIDGKTYIMFLRRTENKEVSLITLEYAELHKAIVQARGSYNRALTESEMQFLNKYCKKMEIALII